MRETFVTEDVLNLLIELETLGNRNYLQLSEKVQDLENKKFFALLGEQELKHKKIYQGFKEKLSGDEHIDEAYQNYAQMLIEEEIPVIKGLIIPEDMGEALKLAIMLEKQTLFFLHEIKAMLPLDMSHSIDPLVIEERKHLQFLYQYGSEKV